MSGTGNWKRQEHLDCAGAPWYTIGNALLYTRRRPHHP